MESLHQLNMAVLPLLVITFMVLSVLQVVHIFLLASRKEVRRRGLSLAYEGLVLAHLLLAVFLASAVFRNYGELLLDLAGLSIPLSALLWFNMFAVVLGGCLSVAGRKPSMVFELALMLCFVPPVAEFFGDYWWVVFVLDAAFFLFRVIAGIKFDLRHRNVFLSSYSPMNAMNALPEGIMYFNQGGRILYMNDAMRDCLVRLGISGDLVDAWQLWKRLLAMSGSSGKYVGRIPDAAKVVLPDSEVRHFKMDDIRLRGVLCKRVMAVDITEGEWLNHSLEAANLQLEQTQEELKRSIDDLQEVVENESVLLMRSRVHDVIGQRLSILHRYLEDGVESPEAQEKITRLLNTVIEDLGSSDASSFSELLTALVDAFSLAGVELEVKGELPRDHAMAGAFVRIVREAATNATLHAQAKHVTVSVSKSNKAVVLTIINDGAPFVGPMEEHTGIFGMRQAAESVGGEFSWYAGPPFTVQVTVPVK